MSFFRLIASTTTISTSLVASGGIAALSLFDIPELQAQPASRSLPSIRWLFSRGSHIFPTAAVVSTTGYLYLAVSALPAGQGIAQIVKLSSNGFKVNGNLVAAALTVSFAAFTSVMIPTNFTLIEMNEQKGGARSQKSAQQSNVSAGQRSADDSVNGHDDVNQFSDLSGPQAKAQLESTSEEDEKVRQLLGNFGQLNAVRAMLCGAGGIVGLVAALA